MDTFNFSRFMQNGVVVTRLAFALAVITASLIITVIRWLHRHVVIHENLLYRRYEYTGLKSSRRKFRLCQLEPGHFETPSKPSCHIIPSASMSTRCTMHSLTSGETPRIVALFSLMENYHPLLLISTMLFSMSGTRTTLPHYG